MNPNEEEQQRKPSIVEQQGKKMVKKKAGAVAKKAAKVAAKAAVKALAASLKALLAWLIGLGAPVLLIIAGIGLLVLIIYLIVAMFFSNTPEILEGEALALQQHIVAAADATVDMSRPEQVEYRVPHELIIAAIQIYDSGRHGVSEKDAASLMAKTLAPIFTYRELEGSIENEITTCVDGSCSTTTQKIPFTIEPLERVEAWDVVMDATFTPHTTEWQQATTTSTTSYKSVEKVGPDGKVIPNEYEAVAQVTTVSTKSRTHTYLIDEVKTEDYTYYDRVLSQPPFDYGQQDKFIVEAVYETTGGYINYTGWLTGNSLIGFDGAVTPGAGVPAEFMAIYLAAEKKYKVDWYYLAALHWVETGYSTHPTMISGVGAEGHMQFMPCTFVGWSYPGCKGGNGFVDIPPAVKTNLGTIKKYGGLGVDGDGDGKADPWNVADAIFTAANYLSKSGFSSNIDKAILAYNHADWYVEKVKKKAMELKDGATYSGGGEIPQLAPGSFMRPAAGTLSSKYGPRDLKNGFHYGADISNSIGTPVVAMADGKVIRYHSGCPQIGYLASKCGLGWGNHVYIEHVVQGQKFVAVYAHFSKTMAPNGSTVKQGQVVGLMGASGSVTGPHVHVELHKGSYKRPNNVLNPHLYIPF